MPENWKEYKLKDLTSVITKGTTPSTYGFNFEESGINYIRAQSLSYDGKIDEGAFSFISEEAHKRLTRSQLQPGDILFSMAGAYLGMTGMVRASFCPANTNQAVGIIRINNSSVSHKFVEYLLRNPSTVSFVNAQSGQSAQPNINLAEIGNLAFEFPPLEEQKSIASILSALDDKIELNLQMNKTLEEMAMALYKYWFVDFGPFQDKEFVDSELGEIPKGWEVKSIGQVVKIIGGFAFKSKDFKESGETVVKIKNISNNVVSIAGSDCIGYEIGAKTNKKFLIKPGSFLVAMTGAEVGKVGVVPDYSQKLWLNQRVGMITEPSFESADTLIGNFLQSSDGYETIQNLAYGSAQPNISTTGLEGISLPIPNDISVIAEFLKKINNWHQMKISNYSENVTLTQLRDTLLPKLISGEVRVKDVEKTLTEVL